MFMLLAVSGEPPRNVGRVDSSTGPGASSGVSRNNAGGEVGGAEALQFNVCTSAGDERGSSHQKHKWKDLRDRKKK